MEEASVQQAGPVPAIARAGRQRALVSISFLLICVALIAGSHPRRTGDGAEYMSAAHRFSKLEPAAIEDQEFAAEQAYLASIDAEIDTGFKGYPLNGNTIRNCELNSEYSHFWLYPLMASPFVGAADSMGFHPNYGFTVLNVLLMIFALWVVSSRISPAASLLVFVSPVIWWLDKAHTEVFTFAFVAIALATALTQPWWAMISLGIAATQNPGIALGIPLIFVAQWFLGDRQLRKSLKLRLGAGLGLAITLIHPLYYLVTMGHPSLIVKQGADPRFPRLNELGAVLWEPNLGLAFNAPLLTLSLLGAVGAVMIFGRRSLRLDALVAVLLGGAFLFSFSQTFNFNHGGTPGMSRYAVWLIPLAIPILRSARESLGPRFEVILAVFASLSAILSIVTFHPKEPEAFFWPTRAANYLWDERPSWSNPPPEVFLERVLHVDNRIAAPAATENCSKVLVREGYGPQRCPLDPAPPPECSRVLCYANRVGDEYRFKVLHQAELPNSPKKDPPCVQDALKKNSAHPVAGHVKGSHYS